MTTLYDQLLACDPGLPEPSSDNEYGVRWVNDSGLTISVGLNADGKLYLYTTFIDGGCCDSARKYRIPAACARVRQLLGMPSLAQVAAQGSR